MMFEIIASIDAFTAMEMEMAHFLFLKTYFIYYYYAITSLLILLLLSYKMATWSKYV